MERVLVINESGREIYFEDAVNLMDDELREQLANDGNEYTDQEFFTAYEIAHEQKYGEPWELSKFNPVW